MNGLATFAEKWSHADYPPMQVRASDLSAAEMVVGRLPASYRAAILEVGLPRPTAALLDSIVENESDLPDIGDFFAPDEIVDSTNSWRAMGMPNTMTAFASDCMGNLFAFAQDGGDEGPVYFFDHDAGETVLLADSFAKWIARYCEVPWKALERLISAILGPSRAHNTQCRDWMVNSTDREVVRRLSETVDLPEDCVSFLLEHAGGEVQLAPHANVFPRRFSAVWTGLEFMWGSVRRGRTRLAAHRCMPRGSSWPF